MPTALEKRLRRAAGRLPGPSRRSTERARAAALEAFGEAVGARAGAGSGVGRAPFRLLAAAVVLVAGAAGLGLVLAPGETTASPVVVTPAGPGFLPARGWSTFTAPAAAGRASEAAVAANVPVPDLQAGARLPLATVRRLPAGGIVVAASFRLRGGDRAADRRYPERHLPFTILDANVDWPDGEGPHRGPIAYHIRGAASGYNIDVTILFGGPLTEGLLAQAQDQLGRLAVPPITLRAHSTVASGPGAVQSRPVELFGTVETDKPEDGVVLEMKECGTTFFRHFASLHTDASGIFHSRVAPPITTTYRVSWRGAVSRPLTVRARPGMRLRQLAGGRFDYEILALRFFRGASMYAERFDRRTRRWVRVERYRLDRGQGGRGTVLWTTGRIRIPVARGTLVRLVLPDAQSGPCYAAGYSNLVTRR